MSNFIFSGQHIICHKFEGGLGSLLFQYASLTSIAKGQNRLLVSRGDLSLSHLLRHPQVRSNKNQCRNVVRITESACCRLDENVLKLDVNKNYDVDGVLQSWKYFKDNLDTVRRLVEFHDGVVHQAKKVIENTLLAYNHTTADTSIVGVHVRRGDKLHWKSVDEGYRVAPREYFLKAMTYFRDHVSASVAFLVVSDDHAWCKSNLLGLPGVMVAQPGEPAVDLNVLALLDHTIISMGSFSWWAGFLAKGKVVYYSDFAEKDSKIRGQFDAKFEDYVLSEWIPMA